jgi:carbon-monoxide dehydrogenase small subunit
MSITTPPATGEQVAVEPDRTTVTVALTINGVEHNETVEARLLLVHLLRQRLGLTGTHIGCDTSSCGACTVLIDGVPAKSCTMLAAQASGRAITTVEGLATAAGLAPIQEAFHQEHGLQCGFCTPGMMLAANALLEENQSPTDEEIRWALSGNVCRCTGYVNIVKSVQDAARRMREAAGAPASDGGEA